MIEHAAIKYDGKVFVLERPNRHSDIIHWAVQNGYVSYGEKHKDKIEGFVDEHGEFYDRGEAMNHARACGQIERGNFQPDHLFSEDLW